MPEVPEVPEGHIPWADRPWDQVIPGLWIGGHRTQTQDAVVVRDEFDLVVSLFKSWGHGPNPGAKHLYHQIEDADLDVEHHTELDILAEEIVQELVNGKKVLVRCNAGINRSGLLVGLAMIKMGWSVDDILIRLRHARSPYALANQSFVRHLREVEELEDA